MREREIKGREGEREIKGESEIKGERVRSREREGDQGREREIKGREGEERGTMGCAPPPPSCRERAHHSCSSPYHTLTPKSWTLYT